ncbi:MAG: DUF4403 family protein [Bacteroidia bacterium]
MNIHFRLPYTALASYLNSRFDGVLFDGELARSSAQVRVEKTGPIGLDGEGDKLYVSVPLKVQARLTLREKLFGDMLNLIPKVEQTQFSLTVHFSIRLFANERWELQSSTLGSFRWVEKPEFGLGPLKVKSTAFLRGIILDEVQDVSEQIDEAIKNDVALRSRLEAVWAEVQEPIQLHDDPPVWLHISPDAGEAKREPVFCDHFQIDTAVYLPLRLNLGLNPNSGLRKPFPEFTPEKDIEESFSGTVQSEIHYQKLADWYIRKKFSLPGQLGEIQFNSVEAKGEDGVITLNVVLEGQAVYGFLKSRFEATAFISFRPVINEQKHIEAGDLTVDLKTSKWWLRNIWRFGKKRLKDELTSFIKNLLQSIDDQVEKELERAFKGKKISSQLRLEGKLKTFRHTDLRVAEDRLMLGSVLEGEMVFVLLAWID